MISLKRLIMNPKSPDRAIQQGYSEAESALARIAHVNRLSRDIMDIKYYDVDFQTSSSATLRISSKKGIIHIENMDPNVDELFLYLENSEITYEREKFYIQLTGYATGNAIPLVAGAGFAPTQFQTRIYDVKATGTPNWGILYMYYEIVKID